MLLLRLLLLAVMKLDVILIYVMNCGLIEDIDAETIQKESVANTLSNRQFPSPQRLGFDSRSNLFFSGSFSTAY